MSKLTREEKLFKRENNTLESYKEFTSKPHTLEETQEALAKLTQQYENLLHQTRFLTWISGRLERKLQRANRELQDNNNSLQAALNALTKAEASRSAYAIIYTIAIGLFVLEQFFIDPIINAVGGGISYGIIFKLAIVLLLKVSEGLIEKRITKQSKLTSLQSS